MYFQEDNDPSYGTRTKNNIAYRTKQALYLVLLTHPAQSPDLNLIESIWQIIKQRLRGRTFDTVEAFKAAIQAEWEAVTIKQIRKRILEMKSRCEKVILLDGKRIRSQLW
jgi:transposase